MSYLFNWRSKRAKEMKIAHFPHLSMFSGGTGKWDVGTSEGRATLFTLTPSRPTRNRTNPRALLNSNQTHSYLNVSNFSSGDWKKFCKIVWLNLILYSLSPHKTTSSYEHLDKAIRFFLSLFTKPRMDHVLSPNSLDSWFVIWISQTGVTGSGNVSVCKQQTTHACH